MATLTELNVVIKASIDDFEAKMGTVQAGIGRLGDVAKSAGQSLSTHVTLPLGLLAAAAVTAYGKLDSLQRGINAITTQELTQQGVSGFVAVQQAAEMTAARVKELAEIAKAPGIGFEQAEKGDVRLRAVGISARDSAKDLKEFANAVATSGGSAADFDRVTVQLAQLSAKGKVLAQDLRPIIEAAPSVAAALQKLYGTIDSEDISKILDKQGKSSSDFINTLTDELAKLPRVTGGIANALENFEQGAVQDAARLGESLNKSLGLEDLLARASAAISGLVDSFTSLDPSTQAVILGFAGVAAAIGPVVYALGSILSAVPSIVAGFALVSSGVEGAGAAMVAFATGPIGLAVAGIAALAAGIYYAATASDRALDSYREQAKQADALTASVTPLLARYTELSEQTTRSAAEQAELASIIRQLADAVPSATTAIDQYGNATAISAGAVSEFTKALQEQKAANAALNLPAAVDKLDELAGRYKVLQQQVDEFNKTGSLFQSGFDGDVVTSENAKAGSAAVRQLQADLANANVAFLKQKQLVDELRGSTQALAETDESLAGALTSVGLAGGSTAGILATLRDRLKEVKEQREGETSVKAITADNKLIASLEEQIKKLEGADKGSRKYADALAALQKALRDNGNDSRALADAYEYLKGEQSALESGIKSLISAGYTPAGKVVQGYVARLRELNTVLGDNDLLQSRQAENLKKMGETPAFKLQLPDKFDTPQLPQQLDPKLTAGMEFMPGYVDSIKAVTAQAQAAYAQMSGEERQAYRDHYDAQAEFNTQTQQLADAFPYAAFDAIGQAIGNALATGGNVFEAAGRALLKTLADFGEAYGKQLILLGIADIATGLFVGKGLAEVAAGTALIAGSAVVGTLASGGGGSLASSGGSYNAASTNKAVTPTIKVEAVFKLRGEDLVAVGKLGAYRQTRTS